LTKAPESVKVSIRGQADDPQGSVYEYGRLTASAQLGLVESIVSSGQLGAIGGSVVPELENMIAARISRAYGLATSTATAGMEIALRALGAKDSKEVVIPSLGWVSVGTAVAATGAAVKVATVSRSLTLGWDDIAPLLCPATVAVVVAHLRGFPDPEIPLIASELHRRGIPLIEDCAQAWGVRVTPERAAGSYGTAAVFSLQHSKLVTAGEGGLVVADDGDLMTSMRVLTGHNNIPVSRPVWRGNARMTEVTAALAVPQLSELDQLVGGLQVLQRQVVTELTEESVAERVIPDPGDLEISNGLHVGAWWPSAGAAQALAGRLRSAGLRVWQPTAGDLHTSTSWPVSTELAPGDLDRYLDLQMPALRSSPPQAFLAAIRTALADTGLLVRQHQQ
jgi:dTDP-4-amino-4,6-dideoxygalactose transaminase